MADVERRRSRDESPKAERTQKSDSKDKKRKHSVSSSDYSSDSSPDRRKALKSHVQKVDTKKHSKKYKRRSSSSDSSSDDNRRSRRDKKSRYSKSPPDRRYRSRSNDRRHDDYKPRYTSYYNTGNKRDETRKSSENEPTKQPEKPKKDMTLITSRTGGGKIL
jgi:hypothetical protein